MPGQNSERAIILAPTGRDGDVASLILRTAGFTCDFCSDLNALTAGIVDGAGLAIIADEALINANLRPVSELLASQPSWSDFPIILMTRQGGGPERNPAAVRWSELLGNITFLERPFHPTTLISLVRTAVRSRRRQYEARTTLAELSESEQTLQAALKAGHLGSWLLDVKHQALLASATCKSHFGRSKDEQFSYDNLLASVHPDDVSMMRARVEKSIVQGEDYAIEYRNIWPDGAVHWVDVRGRAVKSNDGRVLQLIGVSSDITNRKTAEEERERLVSELAQRQVALSHLTETLEQRVEERTQQLHEKEATLQQIQKMEVMGQLTGGVAHDFNNLLMAVMGNLDLLRKQYGADARSKRLIDGAMQGAQRGAALTQRMLAFARQQELQTHSLDLSTLITGIRDLLERSIGPQFELKLIIDDAMPAAEADANQIELAILNLVVNARDAMPNGGPITITADYPETIPSDLAPGRYVRIAVADSGTGMSPETLKKAVEPFFSTKEVGKGTGLGLSMVHGMAMQHGGLFDLTSVEGQGTTASLWLPVAESVVTKSQVAVPVSEVPVRKATILVVDDDMLISMATVDMLEDLGHTVLEANSGKRALEIISSDTKIDVMMTDYAMPGMTGAELADLARQQRPGLPILLATGYADLPANRKSDLPRLAKPYMQETLKLELERLLSDSATRS